MYHDMPSKKYDVAVQVADILFDKGIIEGVISFGGSENYNKHKHPKGLKAYYGNATKSGVAEVFNQCKAYLMPSVSEGLNLTPIESTLCGCPAVICDGAIDEIFIHSRNCYTVRDNNLQEMAVKLETIITHGEELRINTYFNVRMREQIKGYTWSNVANKIKEIL
jgi:glycosyltransferase involved in cell wall biosynthesis